MKHIYILFSVVIMIIGLHSCSNESADIPDFAVSLGMEQVIEMKGDTFVCKKNEMIKFVLSGNPDMLTYYSGKAGSEYKYRDRTISPGIPKMQFTTQEKNGEVVKDVIHVYVSTTFPGITNDEETDRENIRNMSYWKEITELCELPNKKNTTSTSPWIDLTEYKTEPFYLAFRFLQTKAAGKEANWTFSNLKIVNETETTQSVLGTFGTIGLTAFDMNADHDPYLADAGDTDKNNKRWDLKSLGSNKIMVGGSSGNTIDNDDWVISSSLELNKCEPDRGVAIKGMSDAILTEQTEMYEETGKYVVTFVGINSKFETRKEQVREIYLEIVE